MKNISFSGTIGLSTGLILGANICMQAALATPPTPILPGLLPPQIDMAEGGDAQLLSTVDLEDNLKVKVYKHKLLISRNAPEAWSYITEGLRNVGQAEIVLTVLKREGEKDLDYPQLPVQLFASIMKLARQDKVVNAGGYTEFKTAGFLAPQFRGILYAAASNVQGVPLPIENAKDYIAMVPITNPEMEVYQVAGAGRLMAKMGLQAKIYPCPTWCDRDRESAFSEAEVAEMKEDPVFKSAKAQTFSVTAIQDKGGLSLRLTEKTAHLLQGLLNQLPVDSALRLALGIDPRADAMLVWESKSKDNRSMIAPSGSRYNKIGITFIALLPGLDKNEVLTGNDGCALMLTKSDYDRFKTALAQKSDFSLPMGTTSALKTFSIHWKHD